MRTEMHTYNEILVEAQPDRCFRAAADVERWPTILPHYRYVRFERRDGFGRGRVEMAAFRDFGPLRYPVRWVSEMDSEEGKGLVRYHHVDGITRGMDVVWRVEDAGSDTRLSIVHDWTGPGWPLIGGFAARQVIGPRFVHVVAGRTLAGIKRSLEEPESPGGGPVGHHGP